jgi:hypothetical protein
LAGLNEVTEPVLDPGWQTYAAVYDAPMAPHAPDAFPRRSPSRLARVARFALAYAVAAVVETVVAFSWPRAGHADVPLTMFPDYLVLAPIVPPLFAWDSIVDPHARAWVSTAVFVACIVAVWFATAASRRPR